jgi:hypothetical protein
MHPPLDLSGVTARIAQIASVVCHITVLVDEDVFHTYGIYSWSLDGISGARPL